MVLLPSMAQTYVVVNDDELPMPLSEVERITYQTDDQFRQTLLPSVMAADANVSIFAEALKRTALADSLEAYIDPEFHSEYKKGDKYYYYINSSSVVADVVTQRLRQFTVFAETDSVLRAHDINSMADLEAYAKQVYNTMYPEDAAVTDPTDRRHPLNRFVAYHILRHGSTYHYLTAEDEKHMNRCFDQEKTDIAAWYSTMMPHAALKCSFPAGEQRGLYLNHRGLKDGPDKYGVQVRGAKILPSGIEPRTTPIAPGLDSGEGEDYCTREAFNGYYFYIDDLLCYDQTARDVVLGGELWRVDCKTLLPDLMNVFRRGGYWYRYDCACDRPGEFPAFAFEWKGLQGITNARTDVSSLLSTLAPDTLFPFYEGDELVIKGDFDFTVTLPHLPPGDWEVRLGQRKYIAPYLVKIFLNGEQQGDIINLSTFYDESGALLPNILRGPDDCGTSGSGGNSARFSQDNTCFRRILGSVQSDGSTPLTLRIENCTDLNNPTMSESARKHLGLELDYLEFCPKALSDNGETPEE